MQEFKIELCLKIKSLNYSKIELYRKGVKVLNILKNQYINSKNWGVEIDYKENIFTFNYDKTIQCEFDDYKVIE